MVVVFLHARRGIVVVVFLPARRGLWYARQTSLMRGGLPSYPVRPLVCAVVLRSARCGMRGGLLFCSARHARCSSFPPGAACTAVFRSARCGIRGGLPFCLAWPSMCGRIPFSLAWPGVHGGVPFRPARQRCSVLSGVARYVRWCCGSIIGGPGSLVTLPDDAVISGASDPRSWRCSRHAAQRCVKVS